MSYKIMSGWLSGSWNSVEVGWRSSTMILNTELNLLQNDFKENLQHHHSPNLDPVEMLCNDLKKAVHSRHLKNMAELMQSCKEEKVQNWSFTLCRSHPQLVQQHFFKVIDAKGDSTGYWSQSFTVSTITGNL